MATLQHTSAAGTETEPEHVGRHVGACLVNHADNAERHTHLGDLHAVGSCFLPNHVPVRLGQTRHVAHVGGNSGDPLRSQFKAVVIRVGRIHPLQVGGVFGEYGVGFLNESVGHLEKDSGDALGGN